MKQLLPALVLLFVFCASPLFAENYVLSVNGAAHEIGLDREVTLQLADGTALNVMLHHKEYLTFAGDLFSFEHKNEYKPNRSDLGDGIFQTMIVTPLGSGLLVQEYKTMDPSGLVDMMLNELTKEEVEYGYEYNEKKVQKKIDGVTFTGKQAVTSYQDDEWLRSVYTLGGKDQGLLIVTFIEKENYKTESDILDRFWRSLKVQ